MRLKNRKKSAAAIKSMKVGTDELKDLIKGAVKEAMGEEDDTGDDGRDTAAALDGVSNRPWTVPTKSASPARMLVRKSAT